MKHADRMVLARDIQDAIPDVEVSVRFHGSPKNAPSMPRTGVGCFTFRTWGRTFVSVHPERPLTDGEWRAFCAVRHTWDEGSGTSIIGGADDLWPIEE